MLYHVVSPLSRGLFTMAAAHSSAPFSTAFSPLFSPPEKSRQVAAELGRNLGCAATTDQELLACLRSKPYQEIIAASDLCQLGSYCVPWNAVVDSEREESFLPDTPPNLVRAGQQSDVPLIVGVNSEEGIYSAGRYILDPQQFREINENWDRAGPMQIFDSPDPSPQQSAAAQTVKEFYLGGEPASMATIHQVRPGKHLYPKTTSR